MIDCREWMIENSTRSSVQLIDCMGSDRSVVNSARVSYAKDELTKKELDERDRKLINYLAKNKHTLHSIMLLHL